MPVQVWPVATSIGWTAIVGTMLLYMILYDLRTQLTSRSRYRQRASGHHVDGGCMAEILLVRNATR